MSLANIRAEIATQLLSVAALGNRVFTNRFAGNALQTLPAAVVMHTDTTREQMTLGLNPRFRYMSAIAIELHVASGDPATDLDALGAASIAAIEGAGARTLDGDAFNAVCTAFSDEYSAEGDIPRGMRALTFTVEWQEPTTAITPPPVFQAYSYSATGRAFTAFNYTIASDATAATFTLPSAVGIAGRVYVLKNIGGGILQLSSADGIDDLPTQEIGPYEAIKVQSTGADWIII